MQKITTHSKSGLFLMEMIFVLLFLGLTSGICVRLFAASYTAREKAQESEHIRELTTSVCEILEGTDGSAQSFLSIFPDGIIRDDTVCFYFDRQWNPVTKENGIYRMELTLTAEDLKKTAVILFTRCNLEPAKTLYELTVSYPAVSSETPANAQTDKEDLS